MDSKDLDSTEKIRDWLHLNMPVAIRPFNDKGGDRGMVNPFSSQHAFNKVCEHFAVNLNEKLNKQK